MTLPCTYSDEQSGASSGQASCIGHKCSGRKVPLAHVPYLSSIFLHALSAYIPCILCRFVLSLCLLRKMPAHVSHSSVRASCTDTVHLIFLDLHSLLAVRRTSRQRTACFYLLFHWSPEPSKSILDPVWNMFHRSKRQRWTLANVVLQNFARLKQKFESLLHSSLMTLFFSYISAQTILL